MFTIEQQAALCVLGGQFDDAKKALEDGSKVAINFTVRVSGVISKGKSSLTSRANPAINPLVILAAMVEQLGADALASAIALATSESFTEAYAKGGGDSAVIADLATALGVPAKIDSPRAGSVSGKGLIVEAVDGANQLAG